MIEREYMSKQVPAVTDAAASDAKNLLKKAARSTRMAQGSRADDAGDRAGRDFHEAVRADDPSVRQHDGRTCGDSEPDVRDLRDGQHGGGRECVDDVRVGAVQHIHESVGTAGGVPAGLCLHDAVGRVHRTGAGSARAARGGGNLTFRTGTEARGRRRIEVTEDFLKMRNDEIGRLLIRNNNI